MQTLESNAYLAYSYSYPHKTAYRQFAPHMALRDIWDKERREALFLYMHIPFCEMRCGFCNLFTMTNAGEDLVAVYLDALERQAQVVSDALAPSGFSRFAVGGGTPTFLEPRELERVFDIAAKYFNVDPHRAPTSVETSPLTATLEKMRILSDRGVSRVSIGVQSFIEEEVRAVGRAQKTQDVLAALQNIRDARIPTLNIDLIYGIPGQTEATWLASIDQALQCSPEEIYLYPLYVRPLTGLGKRADEPKLSDRLRLYRAGREHLLNQGYEQLSMRMFRARQAPDVGGPVYCCQKDGMVGIGCGARSYTSELHYSSRYAVSAKPIKAIIEQYATTSNEEFGSVDYGFVLDELERRRRYVIQSLLQREGLNADDYGATFAGREAITDFPELTHLLADGLAEKQDRTYRLSAVGLELSDQIGVSFYSPAVQSLMRESVVV